MANWSNKRMLWVGVVCAVTGNVLNSISFLLQRHVQVVNNADDMSYLRFPMWWAGLACMVAGEIGNLAAYGMAPASLVSPLGAVAVVSNALLSRVFLGEMLSYRGMVGVVLALAGSVLVVLNTPTAGGESGIYSDIVSWRGLAVLMVAVMGCIILANPLDLPFLVPRELANRYAVFYCLMCSLLGAITVASAKGIATAVDLAAAGDVFMFTDKDTAWLTYVLMASVIAANVLQVVYLNTALRHFCASVVMPVYYILFTSVTIATGMVLFNETVFDPFVRCLALFITGVVLAFAGVYLVDVREEVQQPVAVTTRLHASFRSWEVRNYMCTLGCVFLRQ
jgi:uncharacterized membrane protein